MYTGIVKNHNFKKEADLTGMEYVELLTCDPKWQICLFDFTYKNKVPDYFVFRVEPNSFQIIENYYFDVLNDFTNTP